MLKHFAVLAAVVAPLAAGAQNFQPGRLPASSRDTFDVAVQGRSIGTFVVSHSHTGDNITLVTVANLAQMGMVATDSVVFNATSLAPVLMTSSQSMGPMSIAGRVTIANGKATGTMQQPGPGGVQNLPVDATVGSGIIGEGADALLIPTLDLKDGFTANFQTFDAKSGKNKAYALKVLGKETVTVPAGTFETWKLEVTSDDTAQMWVTTSEPRKIVMLRLEAQQIDMKRVSK